MQARRVDTQNNWISEIRSEVCCQAGWEVCSPDVIPVRRPSPNTNDDGYHYLSIVSIAVTLTAVLFWLKPYHNSSRVVSWDSLWTVDIAMDTISTAHVSMAATSLQKNGSKNLPISRHSRIISLAYQTETAKLNSQIWPTFLNLRLLSPSFWFRSRFP